MATARYSTYGNVAYDLNTAGEAYFEAPGIAVPQYRPEAERQTKVREKPEVRRKAHVSALTVFMAILAVGLIVLNLLSYAMLVEISKTTTAAEARYAALQQDNAKLLVKYEQTFNMNEVEDYAVNVMGMTRPAADQKVQVDTVRSDKAVVYTYENENDGNIITDMVNFVSSLLAYFK